MKAFQVFSVPQQRLSLRAKLVGALSLYFLVGAVQSASMADYTAIPPEYDQNAPPLVMLSVSAHEGLFTKAYDDYSDLDGDGAVEVSYKNSIEYQGYFDPDICYSYSLTKFAPSATATNHQCGGSGWSGNFLNWATMTRMDVLRASLYGGKRSGDPIVPDFDSLISVQPTILERALIPPDGHAFAKVFTSASISDFVPFGTVTGSTISLCNVTPSIGSLSVLSGNASTVLYAPLVYVASGSYPRWASHGGTPCDTETPAVSRPSAALSYNVRLEACVKSIEVGNTDRCKAYGASYKPVGVLQQFGETEALRFGLFTGSFDKNSGGGALRRNIKPLVGNTDVTDNEVDVSYGTFLNTTGEGVISTLNRMRISQYDFGSKRYEDCIDDNYGGGLFGVGRDNKFVDKTEFLTLSTGFLGLPASTNESDEDCADWGNPVAEMMFEVLRYFSDAGSATSDFDADDSGFISTLGPVTWEDPITENDSCADCAQVVISIGTPSFDAHDSGDSEYGNGITGLSGTPTSETNAVGTAEGIAGSFVLGGNNDVDANCAVRAVSGNLANFRGSCPDQPLLESGFYAAGIAKHGAITDLRSDRDQAQTVATYAVQMGKDVPTFTFTTAAGNTSEFTPVCYTTADSSNLPCALIDAVIVDAPGDNSVEIDFLWHSQRWGQTYRTELKQNVVIQVIAGVSKVTSTLVGVPLTGTVRHGVVLEGTGDDGTKTAAATVNNYTVVESLSPRAKLNHPLWYAAKYGGFIDGNDNSLPDVASEWDRYDLDGNEVADGIPDNFYDLANSGELRSRLETIFTRIVDRAQSEKDGLSDVVINGGVVGNRLYVQSYYYPVFQTVDINGITTDSVDWVGGVHGLFLDTAGFIREDNGDGALGSYSDDPIITFVFDEASGTPELKIRRYADETLASFTEADFTDLNPVWSAQSVLADISDVISQREYSNDAGNGRHIFTWIDLDKDGEVDDTLSVDNEVLDFTAESFPVTDNNFRYLGLSLPTEATDLVNYIRGEEISGKRSRSIEFTGGIGEDVWRLGDIVNSIPAVVAAPAESYDVLADDDTYTTFRQKYAKRRQMVYVGGNDGLLHAFNAGVWDSASKSFQESGHTLGAEMWAYAPMNLLPHLQWLSNENYSHVFYVDGAVQAFDVNIFPSDATHPNGWGTILVAGMRLGGGEYSIDTDGDLSNDTDLRSAYVILDITNPEVAPTLIAEISDPALGFTTSAPAVVKRRKAAGGSFDSPSVNEWLLVFGSGATELTDVTSTQTNKLFAYDLVNKSMVSINSGVQAAIGESNSSTGDIRSHDWDNDLVDDNLYFGTIGGTPAAPVGTLKQVSLDSAGSNLGLASSAGASEMLDPGRPIQARPSPLNDLVDGSQWVLFGTGRYLEGDDKLSTVAQRYYGLKVPASGTASDFMDVTDIDTEESGAVSENGSPITVPGGGLLGLLPSVIETFGELRNYIRNNKDGWYYDFAVPSGEGAERNFTDTVFFGSVALFTTYQPDGELCDANGEGFLYGLDAFTGVAPPFGPLNFDSGTNYANKVVSLGAGRPSAPQIVRSADGTKAIVQGSDGEVHEVELTSSAGARGRKTWLEIEIEADGSLF